MRITETKEVIHKQIEDVTVGRICDCCGKRIEVVRKLPFGDEYNFFHISTHHSDWGNDSIDSWESYDACSPECAVKMAEAYLSKSFRGINTHEIQIEHARSLNDGTDRDYKHKIYGMD